MSSADDSSFCPVVLSIGEAQRLREIADLYKEDVGGIRKVFRGDGDPYYPYKVCMYFLNEGTRQFFQFAGMELDNRDNDFNRVVRGFLYFTSKGYTPYIMIQK